MATNTGFIYVGNSAGTDRNNYAVAIPYPDLNATPFEEEVFVDAGRNASGETVGQVVGRAIHKQGLEWTNLKCEKWYEMMNWFNNGHFSFYCHFFNFNVGEWQTKLFYRGNAKCMPGIINAETGRPEKFRTASISIVDCGVV